MDASRHHRPVVAAAAFLPHRLSLSPPPSLIVLPRFFCFFSFVPRIKGSLGIFGVHFFCVASLCGSLWSFSCLSRVSGYCRRRLLLLLLLLLLLALLSKAFFVGFLPSGEGDGFFS